MSKARRRVENPEITRASLVSEIDIAMQRSVPLTKEQEESWIKQYVEIFGSDEAAKEALESSAEIDKMLTQALNDTIVRHAEWMSMTIDPDILNNSNQVIQLALTRSIQILLKLLSGSQTIAKDE